MRGSTAARRTGPGPRSDSGPPSADVSAVILVCGSERPAERRLLVEHHESEKSEPDESAVLEENPASEQERLAEDRRHDAHVHGIPDVTIESRHDQALRWGHRRRRAPALQSEAREALDDGDDSGSRDQPAEPAARGNGK